MNLVEVNQLWKVQNKPFTTEQNEKIVCTPIDFQDFKGTVGKVDCAHNSSSTPLPPWETT